MTKKIPDIVYDKPTARYGLAFLDKPNDSDRSNIIDARENFNKGKYSLKENPTMLASFDLVKKGDSLWAWHNVINAFALCKVLTVGTTDAFLHEFFVKFEGTGEERWVRKVYFG